MSESSIVYACSCGYTTPSIEEFRKHLISHAHEGTHSSLGKIDMQTGEVLHQPHAKPVKKRGKAKKKVNEKAKEVKKSEHKDNHKAAIALTPDLSKASFLNLTPRAFSCDYTPIMRSAREAATALWGWPADMEFADFIDTVLFRFFKDRRISLSGYSVIDKEDNNGR